MVFKRYIHKHGKKLGPYYYENVRSPDGDVKTIYVGTNPSHHPKHRLRKPLFFLILVLILILILGGSLFLLQNKAYLIYKVRAQEPDFDIDQILIKVLIKSGEFIEKQLRVMNIGNGQIAIKIDASDLSDIVRIDSNSFTIKPGQTKIVTLNFSSFAQEQKIEQQPGIYVGKLIVKSENGLRGIPIVVEIETKNVLFDTNLNPVAIERRVKQGTDTTIEVRLFNLQSIESSNVDLDYFVKDMNSNTIITESETVVAKTQASFFKTISIPKNLKPGPYVFAAKAKFGNSVGTSSYLFEVVGPEPEANFMEFCKNSILCLGLSLTTILLLFALTAYLYFFIGAYLYEKVRGMIAFPRKRREEKIEFVKEKVVKEEIKRPSRILTALKSFKNKIKRKQEELKQERERKKAEKGELKKQEEIRRQRGLEAKRKEEEKKLASQNLKNFYRVLSESKQAIENKEVSKLNQLYIQAGDIYANLENQEKQEVYDKLMNLYKQINHSLKRKQEEELKRKELDAKQREELLQRRKTERERVWGERREKTKEFFHKIGLYKTPEEKRQINLQKEKNLQEKLRREEELKKKEKLEKQKLLEQKRNAEKIKYEEELKRVKQETDARKQRELERQLSEEVKRKKEEQEKKQKEFEEQRQNHVKAQKIELIKQIEAKLIKNKEASESLNSNLKTLKSEKTILFDKASDIDSKIKKIDNEILDRSKQNQELASQKNSLFEKYKNLIDASAKRRENEKFARDSKIKEVRARFKAEQSAMIKDLQDELIKLSRAQRRKTEKWKRLELKAKIKIKEHELEEELKKVSKSNDEKKKIDAEYKISLEQINKKQTELKHVIANLESQKRHAFLEKKDISSSLQNKDAEMQKIILKLDNITKGIEQLKAELSKLKHGLLDIKDFFSNFKRSFKKEEAIHEKASQDITKEINKEEEPQRQKSEVEELEESIKNLDLFKKINMEKFKVAEETQEPPEKKTFKEFQKALHRAKEAITKNDISKAKKFYVETRNLYVNLSNEEKKEVYNELMDIYNRLS